MESGLLIFKSVDFSTKRENGKRYITGIASTDSLDRDNEKILQDGIDYKSFTNPKPVLLNWEHRGRQNPKYNMGEIVKAGRNSRGNTVITAKLWEDNPYSDGLWKSLQVMKKNDSKANYSLSIELRAVRRNPFNRSEIVKAVPAGCAVTTCPSNTDCLLFEGDDYDNQDIYKSMGSVTDLYNICMSKRSGSLGMERFGIYSADDFKNKTWTRSEAFDLLVNRFDASIDVANQLVSKIFKV